MNNKFFSSLLFLFVFVFYSSLAIASVNSANDSEINKSKTMFAVEYGIVKDNLSDNTFSLMKLLSKAKENGTKKIVFEKGRYDFYPDRAQEHYLYVSNNDEGLKRVIFPIVDFEELIIDGQGANFIFHGGVNPFLIQGSSQITLKNLSIDFQRTFHNEARILNVGQGFMDLHIPIEYPYDIKSGTLKFLPLPDDFADTYSTQRLRTRKAMDLIPEYTYKRMLEFDVNKRETAYMVKDLNIGTSVRAEKLKGERNIRIFHPVLKGTVGNIMVFHPKYRKFPGFIVTESSDILFDNVIIYHAGGMGIIAENCHNVTVKNSRVTPSNGRMVSTTADATHFVNCTGKIELINNVFENQKDDATNIHGIYAMVDKIIDDKTLEVRLQHPQQWGFRLAAKGDLLELVQGPSMRTYGTNQVNEYERVSKEIMKITFVDNIDERLLIGDSVALVRDYPEVLIQGNIIRRNRARGMLLNCRGKTIVENNTFHAPGAALMFQGDANYWFEQGGVSELIIRNNIFDNSNFGVWGKAIIAVDAGIADEYRESIRYNENILIENNVFNVYDKGLILDLFSVNGLIFRNNKIYKTDEYPEREIEQEFFRIEYSDGVDIDSSNEFVGF
ncbi:right-handed parallel beta-helix repeat-containing protein [Shewanella sp. D64]|uniref:right-handed parallel beta-helix repeat-containing protein n=1 Tax=unclassified Shewanella TaxID=196818 RepID=UPI0022BA2A8E|nr:MULTISPECIES: right-handed parallel beta-helix repeat-containing protein [unclassified Shewanella]MEC4724367.1 right-handed parallel beta-helix repeat-containing protein [Shewanella sp. D64]MEC4738879.1 right-handed parallel beta-helix repeat-containing protein [Shewanella sp. E94]WBJ97684.1 right-handed parallel beta-helix repeat-containing protein [Shewanella sp. MTB7]